MTAPLQSVRQRNVKRLLQLRTAVFVRVREGDPVAWRVWCNLTRRISRGR